MIRDSFLIMADAISVGTTADTAVLCTNAIDLGRASQQFAEEAFVAVTCDENIAGAAGLTGVQIDFITSAAAALSSPTVLASVTVAKADFLAGAELARFEIPHGKPALLRYLGVQTTPKGTAPASGGKYTASIVADVKMN